MATEGRQLLNKGKTLSASQYKGPRIPTCMELYFVYQFKSVFKILSKNELVEMALGIMWGHHKCSKFVRKCGLCVNCFWKWIMWYICQRKLELDLYCTYRYMCTNNGKLYWSLFSAIIYYVSYILEPCLLDKTMFKTCYIFF